MNTAFGKNGCFEDIARAALPSPHDFSVSECETGVPELLHFIYASANTTQFVAPAFAPPFNNRASQKALFRQYQRVQHRTATAKRPHMVGWSLGWAEPRSFYNLATRCVPTRCVCERECECRLVYRVVSFSLSAVLSVCFSFCVELPAAIYLNSTTNMFLFFSSFPSSLTVSISCFLFR